MISQQSQLSNYALHSGKIKPSLWVLIVAIVALLVVGIIAKNYYRAETDAIKIKFAKEVDSKAQFLEREISLNFALLQTIKGLFDRTDQITAEDFQLAAQNILSRNNSITAISWEPKIMGFERSDFEQKHRLNSPSFEIKQLTKEGVMARSPKKHWYAPILYMEPLVENEKAIGFDLTSIPNRLHTLESARDTGELVSTPSLILVQDALAKQKSFLTIFAIYKDSPKGLSARQEQLLGFVSGVFKVDRIVNKPFKKIDKQNMSVSLFDISNGTQEILFASESLDTKHYNPAFTYRKFLENIGGRQWEIRAIPSEQFILEHRKYDLYAFLAVSYLLFLVVAIYS